MTTGLKHLLLSGICLTIVGSYMLPGVLNAQVSVWTHHNDNSRTGANLNETQLNTTNVKTGTFGKLFSQTVDASIYAQPLYLQNISIPGKGTHNVVYVATMNDSVYAFDADNNAGANASPLWSVNFTNPTAGITAVPGTDIQTSPNVSGPVGILSTPVIDQSSGTMYLIARTKENGAYFHRLHALDITTGAEKFGGPVLVQPTVSGTGYDASGGQIHFNPKTANQRAALTLVNGRLIIAWSAIDDDVDPYHGWVISYNPTTLQVLNVFNTTPNGSRGGIWQSGSGAAVDAAGNVYFTTGNGDWNGSSNFGNSVFKLNPASGLSLQDYFTPYNWQDLNVGDQDLGVSGPMLIPNTDLLLSGSKTGFLYLMHTGNMGHVQFGDVQIVQSFAAVVGHLHGAPVYYNSPVRGPLVYTWSEDDTLKAFHFNGTDFDPTPVTQSSFAAPGGMPGGILSLSANGSVAGTGILWATVPSASDAEFQVVPGVLRAFDASGLSNELWNSLQKPADDVGNFAKFCPPTIANGKVYLATFSNRLNVYGLNANFTISGAPASRSVLPSSGTTYTITVTAANGFTGNTALSISGLPSGATGTFNPATITGGTGNSTLTITTL